MPRERREIILSAEELVEAIQAHRRVRPSFLPLGRIGGCRIKADASVAVDLVLNHGQSEQSLEVLLKPDGMLEALIRFCIETGIKLPLAGVKSVAVIEGGLALCVRLEQASELEFSTGDASFVRLSA